MFWSGFLVFLIQRPQYTMLGKVKSNILVTNTGATQGCVMSPVLFNLYTHDCKSAFCNCTIVKYADVTVIIGKISNGECDEYVAQVHQFVDWCRSNFLELNKENQRNDNWLQNQKTLGTWSYYNWCINCRESIRV